MMKSRPIPFEDRWPPAVLLGVMLFGGWAFFLVIGITGFVLFDVIFH